MYSIDFVDIHISEYVQHRGRKYVPLPKEIANRKGIINIQNNDEYCFWLAAALADSLEYFAGKKNLHRVTKELWERAKLLNVEGIDFKKPVGYPEFKKFEKNNTTKKLIVRCLEQESDDFFIVKWFHSNNEVNNEDDVLNLFFYKGHFSKINNLSAVLSKQICG